MWSVVAWLFNPNLVAEVGMPKLMLGVVLLCAGAGCGKAGEKAAADKAEFHYQLASSAFYDQNPMEALSELHTALELDPSHKEALHLLGFVYFGRQDYAEAVRLFERALEVDPRYFEARGNLGAVLLAQEKWAAAIEALEPLLTERLYPTPHLLHNNLGWARYHVGDFAKAEEHLKTAIFLKPQMCLAHNNLGRVYHDTARLDLAVRAYDRAISKCTDYQEPYYRLALLYASTGQAELASKSWQKCYELGPETPLGTECETHVTRGGGAP